MARQKKYCGFLLKNENMQFTRFFKHQHKFLSSACKNRPNFMHNACFLDSFVVLKAELEVTNYREGYRYRRPTYQRL